VRAASLAVRIFRYQRAVSKSGLGVHFLTWFEMEAAQFDLVLPLYAEAELSVSVPKRL
jgi:hypothetical protein